MTETDNLIHLDNSGVLADCLLFCSSPSQNKEWKDFQDEILPLFEGHCEAPIAFSWAKISL